MKNSITKLFRLVLPVASLTCSTIAADDTSAEAFDQIVQPFFEQHCLECHGPDKEKGGLRVDQLSPDMNDLFSLDNFHNILDELATQAMPPEDSPQPDPEEVVRVMDVLRSHVATAKQKHNSGGGRPVRRLTRTEFINTVWDLMGVHVPEYSLPADGVAGSFDTDVTSLYTTDMYFETYLEASREAVRRFIESREEEPGERELPVEYTKRVFQQIPRGRFSMMVEAIPPAGYLSVRTAWWRRDGNLTPPVHVEPTRGTIFGRSIESDGVAYLVTGTQESPSWVEKNYFEIRGQVDWSIRGLPSKPYPPKARLTEEQEKKIRSVKGFSPEILVDYQSLLVENPVVLAEIRNVHVISPQPYEFFSPILKTGGSEDSKAPVMLRNFVELMSRGRGADPEFVQDLNAVFLQGREQGKPFWVAMVEPMAIAMCSLESLFHIENKDPANSSQTVTGVELANRLSYILWRSAPDSELLALGQTESLHDPEVKAQQVNRMMQDERFDRFLSDFTDQWLELEKQEAVAVDSRLHGEFSDWVKAALKEETIAFVSHIIRNDLSVTNFIDSDFVVVNNATASHYGILGSFGHEFEAIQRTDDRRGGLLTQAGILLQTGTGDRTSIVERGAFVLRKMLGDEPPPPPPNVDALPTDNEDFAKLPAAEMVKLHASSAQCASCHQKIDSLGLGLEEFDAVGLYRTVETRLIPGIDLPKRIRPKTDMSKFTLEVDLTTQGRMPDGQSFDGVGGLKTALMEEKHLAAKSYLEAILFYANGRTTGTVDQTIVEDIIARMEKTNYPSAAILKAVLYSKALSSY